jgi:hypothetical protein
VGGCRRPNECGRRGIHLTSVRTDGKVLRVAAGKARVLAREALNIVVDRRVNVVAELCDHCPREVASTAAGYGTGTATAFELEVRALCACA